MRKLMIAAAIVCAAVIANAASFVWTDSKYLYNGGGTESGQSSKMTAGTSVYLLLTATETAANIVKGFEDGTLTQAQIISKASATGAINSSNKAAGTQTVDSVPSAIAEAYYIVFNGDNMFVSDAINSIYDSVSQKHTYSFQTTLTDSKEKPITTAYEGAHWYTAEKTEPTPEPTSGLLLVLGLAGLALRRRRA